MQITKGTMTRQLILAHAAARASRVGLEGLSIGQLAAELKLSKSGLFGHFRSKEELQIQVLDTISDQFSAEVIRPALQQPRGVPRLRALFENWLAWSHTPDGERNGCPFLAAAMEFDDRQGPVRDKLVEIQRRWISVMEKTVAFGQQAGAFRADLEPAAAVQEFYSIILGLHLYHRLLRDPHAEARARQQFQAFVQRLQED